MTEVRWTPEAVADLRAIREFIERDSPRYGRLVAERLYDSITRLSAFPHSGRVVPELGREEMREVIVGPYRIVYKVFETHVSIVTVFRSSRLISADLVDR